MNQQQLETLARHCGANHYSEPPMRAVTGVTFTYAQLEQFANAIRADERGNFAQTAVEWNQVQTKFAVGCETDRCCLIVSTLLGDTPTARMVNNELRGVRCSSLCHALEKCFITEDGHCDAQPVKP